MTDYVQSSLGDRIGFDRHGSGPTVIFTAGAGPFRAIDPTTTATAERLGTDGFTAVVWDRLGRGESPADGPLDLERELRALEAVIEEAGAPAVLVGHSSGCAISLAAADAGLAVIGLVLFEAPLAGEAAVTREWAEQIERQIDAEDYTGATETFMRDMPPEWLAGVKASPEWEAIAAGVRSQRADAQALTRATTALEDRSLAAVTVPVLATYGSETFPEMPEAAARIAAVLPNATVRVVPGAGHEWQTDPMAAEITAFARTHHP